MPNPLMRTGRQVTSDPVRERQPITPVPESIDDINHPYRGTEDHGVIPMYKPLAPQQWEDGRPAPVQEPPKQEEPVPVRIVGEAANELRRMRTFGAYTGVNTGQPIPIIGKDLERESVYVKHIIDAATIWLSHSRETCNALNGHPLQKGDDFVTRSQDQLFAWADSADPLTVYVRVEYSQKVD